ncbi:hypothetical protein AC1031_021704 [Aphanomyces cochlioides]|nr:hypothetical protein AC1031_021704 [Aphanomyces cochlioides]
MPWLALPFNAARAVYEELSDKFKVESIPHVVILGPQESRPVISIDATEAVSSDILAFPWTPKLVVDISEDVRSNDFSINEKPSLIVFYESLDVDKQVEIKTQCCKILLRKRKHVIFFTSKDKESETADQLRQYMGLTSPVSTPHAALLDISSKRYYLHQGSLEESDLRQLIDKFHANSLPWKRLGPPWQYSLGELS